MEKKPLGLIEMCDPKTWPCPPLLSLIRKDGGHRDTLIATDGKPRHVIYADCAQVRCDLGSGRDPVQLHSGSDVMRCEELAWDWDLDAHQSDCCST